MEVNEEGEGEGEANEWAFVESYRGGPWYRRCTVFSQR